MKTINDIKTKTTKNLKTTNLRNLLTILTVLGIISIISISGCVEDPKPDKLVDDSNKTINADDSNKTAGINDSNKTTDNLKTKEKVDDWVYGSKPRMEDAQTSVTTTGSPSPPAAVPQVAYESSPGAAPGATVNEMVGAKSGAKVGAASNTMGFSTGGAKDINNFRENIKNNYLPIPTDVTYEGLFYDYYFETGEQELCQKLFCPAYSYAISSDPFSGKEEYYLSVGLNSGMKESDFKRKKLNLIIVLDISGSMSSSFNKYYYDQFGNKKLVEETEENGDFEKSKMQVASESVVALLNNLEDDDRFGMVLFESNAHLAKPLNLVEYSDMQKLKDHVLEISSRGGTQMSAGMKMGTGLYEEFLDVNPEEYENRIIFLTDAMPNLGDTSEQGLLGMTEKNSENRIYTTFIGIGVDFNTELVEYITKIKGANYYSVHSAKQFKTRMDDEFEYMVTPLVFDLKLNLDADGYEIEKVYGSPEADESTGEIMKVNTLFPSKRVDNETRGGLILLKLKKISPDATLKLRTSYEDRNGKPGSDETIIKLAEDENEPEFFENTGIRKGILLSRYANLIKNWVIDERRINEKPVEHLVTPEKGIIIPKPETHLGKWERQSSPLRVSNHYKELFKEFSIYFEKEMNAIGDDTLSRELEVLNNLSNYEGVGEVEEDLNCEEYHYSNCPEGCMKICVPSACSEDGSVCTEDCEGAGSCKKPWK